MVTVERDRPDLLVGVGVTPHAGRRIPVAERGVADRPCLRGAAGVLGLVNSAVVNGLNSAEAFRLSRMGPQELAISIADSHPHLRGISDAELMDALSRFLRT